MVTEAALEELTRALVVDWVDVEGNVVDCVVEVVEVDSLLEAFGDIVGGRNMGGLLLYTSQIGLGLAVVVVVVAKPQEYCTSIYLTVPGQGSPKTSLETPTWQLSRPEHRSARTPLERRLWQLTDHSVLPWVLQMVMEKRP